MSIKWFSLTIAIMALFLIASLSSAAIAQTGYLEYRGPVEPQTYSKAKKPAAHKKTVKRTVKKHRAVARKASGGDSVYDQPFYQSYRELRQLGNREGVGYYNSSNRSEFTNPDARRLAIINDRESLPNINGSNSTFLASIAPGYIQTRQIDINGNTMLVYQGGQSVPQVYRIKDHGNGIVDISDRHGRVRGYIINDGARPVLSLMSNGVRVPIQLNVYNPITNGTYQDNK